MNRPPQVKEGTAAVGSNGRLVFRLSTVGTSRRLVLIHPLAMNSAFWDPVVALLADTTDILVYDVRGHGRSSPIAGDWSAADHARDLAELLEGLGWPRATIAGASMGGCIALAFAADFPGRTEGLGLIDTTSWYDGGPAAWEERGHRALSEGFRSLLPFQLDRWFTEEFRRSNNPLIEHASETFLANDAPSYAAACRMLGAFDLRPRLGDLRQPCRVIVGENDYATPVAMARHLAREISGAELRIIASARHFTPLETPDVVANELRSLVATAAIGFQSTEAGFH